VRVGDVLALAGGSGMQGDGLENRSGNILIVRAYLERK